MSSEIAPGRTFSDESEARRRHLLSIQGFFGEGRGTDGRRGHPSVTASQAGSRGGGEAGALVA
ncbi:MAG: hypothetical protein R3B72_51710 [Polyangiaceae bacterium]